MDDFIRRLRNSLQRAGDRVLGRHVPIAKRAPEIENLDTRHVRVPPSDILESDSEMLIRADTPGANADNTWIYCDDAAGLSVYVKRTGDTAGVHERAEAGDADWYRSFNLPEYVDGASARARLKHGVLTVHVPKRDAPAPVAIPVTAQ